MISEGVNAWQKLCTKSRIHHHCSVATSTFRCAHRTPNLGQVPSDERFRRLFIATPGLDWLLLTLAVLSYGCLLTISADMMEDDMLEILIEGDIHQTNADKLELHVNK